MANVDETSTPTSDSGASSPNPSAGTATVMTAAHAGDSRITAENGVSRTANSASATSGATIALPSRRTGRDRMTASATCARRAGPPIRSSATGAPSAAKVGTAKNSRAARRTKAQRNRSSSTPTMPNCRTPNSTSAVAKASVRHHGHRAPRRAAPTTHRP